VMARQQEWKPDFTRVLLWEGARLQILSGSSRTSVGNGTAPGMEVGLYRKTSSGGGMEPNLVRAGNQTSVRDGTAP
jgi:hypothetical protein